METQTPTSIEWLVVLDRAAEWLRRPPLPFSSSALIRGPAATTGPKREPRHVVAWDVSADAPGLRDFAG